MFWLWWVLIVVVGLVLAYFVIGGIAAITMTKVGEHPQYDKTPESFGVDYHRVVIYSRRDRLKLSAWYLPNGDPERCVLLVHGRNASKQNAISGKIVEFGAALHEAGFSVLMIDLRGHGESEGERYSFGVYERRDVLGAVDFLLKQGLNPGDIGVYGLSMGGGAAIGAAADEPAIGMLVLDSTFADLNPLIEEQWENESGLPKFFLPGVFLMNRLIYGYDLTAVQPVEEIVEVAPRPILIIHCRTDELMSMWHPQTLIEAVPSAKSSFFDACEHAEIYREYPNEYQDLVVAFLNENLE